MKITMDVGKGESFVFVEESRDWRVHAESLLHRLRATEDRVLAVDMTYAERLLLHRALLLFTTHQVTVEDFEDRAALDDAK